MKRLFYQELLQWKESPRKKPLIVKGVRQCGKTYLIERFAQENYEDYVRFTFEGNVPLISIFERDMDVDRMIDELSALRRKRITPETLIFLDEIQFCDAALSSLKYFNELRPEYDIICAGSLLGVKLSKMRSSDRDTKPKYSYPVGKVDVRVMYPMDFAEFILAVKGDYEYDLLTKKGRFDTYNETELRILGEAFDEYLAVGGMPEAVNEWVLTRDPQKVTRIQKQILSDYNVDMLNYAPASEVVRINAIWNSFANQLAKENGRFFFSQVVSGGRASQLEDALHWLTDAGLLYRVPLMETPHIPITTSVDDSKFKIYCCDCGLLHMRAGLSVEDMMSGDQSSFFRGALVENYVCSELAKNLDDSVPICYWKGNDQRHEVDFVVQYGGMIIPIEVKSGKVKRAVSLEEYIRRYEPENAIIASHENLHDGKVRFVPLYLMGRIRDYLSH